MKKLIKLIESNVFLNAITAHDSDASSSAMLESDYQLAQELIAEGVPLYGSASMEAFNDSNSDTNTFLDDILNSYMIGFGPAFSAKEVNLIAKALVLNWQAGGTGISPETYDKFCAIMEFSEHDIYIPKNCAHSSNNLIPASHLLKGFLDAIKADDELDTFDFPATDIIPFISGNFIQLGYCASLVEKMDKNWINFCTNTAHLTVINNSNESNFISFGRTISPLKLISHMQQLCDGNKAVQDPISIRGASQYLTSYFNDTERYLSILNESLSTPSGNPLFLQSYQAPLSQASFLGLEMTSATLAMISATKMLISVIVSRTSYLLSGEVSGIPSLSSNNMPLAQVPTLLMAIDERVSLRMPLSATPTSNISEDGCGNGIALAGMLDEIMTELQHALVIERYVHAHIAGRIDLVKEKLARLRYKKAEDGTTMLLNGLDNNECRTAIKGGLRAYMKHLNLNADSRLAQNVFDRYSIQRTLLNRSHQP